MIPHEVRRQGLNQGKPCPGDMVEFTCTRSESSAATIRWTVDGVALYTFGIPDDIASANANQSTILGLTAIILNATTLKLLVDLSTTITSGITNSTGVVCGEIGGNSSQTLALNVIGKSSNNNCVPRLLYYPKIVFLLMTGLASVPIIENAQAVSFTSLYLTLNVPEYGSICVDEYSVSITLFLTPILTINQTLSVSNPNQQRYIFSFTVDINAGVQINYLMFANVTAVAITNGLKGSFTTEKRRLLHCHDAISYNPTTLLSQTFTSTGIWNTIMFEVAILLNIFI